MWFSEKIVSSFSPEEMRILEIRLNEGQTWLLLCNEKELRQELIHGKQETIVQDREVLSQGIPTSYTRAREILGDDFITPGEIVGFSYTYVQHQHFSNTLPSEDILHWCKGHKYAVVPGPPYSMRIIEVMPRFSCAESGVCGAPHTLTDMVNTEWLAIKKEPLYNLSDQGRFFAEMSLGDKRIPNIAEVAWFSRTFLLVRYKWLFEKTFVITSSECPFDSRYNWVCAVGFFNDKNFSAAYHLSEVNAHKEGVQLAPILKL